MRAPAHQLLQLLRLVRSTDLIEHITKTLKQGNGGRLRSQGELLGVNPLCEFSKHRRDLTEAVGMTLIADEVDRRGFRRRDRDRAPQCVELLCGNTGDTLPYNEFDADAAAGDPPPRFFDEYLKLHRTLMCSTVILRRRQKARIVGELQTVHQVGNELIGWQTP